MFVIPKIIPIRKIIFKALVVIMVEIIKLCPKIIVWFWINSVQFVSVKVKFVFFEKATKFDEISILLLTNKFVFFVSRYSFEHQSGSQSWNFIHWDQPNPSKVYLFLDTDKFVLSFLVSSNKNQLNLKIKRVLE